ncbi:hypothetical protein PtA15_8A149 [Puccinia triticina]|uniref:Stm1-like N-terminal domain-containing protein n=1 Tax=Puccinia triticina TaxID=208348 RepID=A0ABY7CPS0_9BASI|nr:uncharacterized protein PtA15_8A149 [Puccinia triticina]WAQ87246.1 hypothetical protein PtA15_8A149 [Puccinia triticina]
MYDKAEEAAESGDHAKAGILLKICKGLSQVAAGPNGIANPPSNNSNRTNSVQKVDFMSVIPAKKLNSTNPGKEGPKPSKGSNQQTQQQGGYKGNRFNPRHNKRDSGGRGSHRKDRNH